MSIRVCSDDPYITMDCVQWLLLCTTARVPILHFHPSQTEQVEKAAEAVEEELLHQESRYLGHSRQPGLALSAVGLLEAELPRFQVKVMRSSLLFVWQPQRIQNPFQASQQVVAAAVELELEAVVVVVEETLAAWKVDIDTDMDPLDRSHVLSNHMEQAPAVVPVVVVVEDLADVDRDRTQTVHILLVAMDRSLEASSSGNRRGSGLLAAYHH